MDEDGDGEEDGDRPLMSDARLCDGTEALACIDVGAVAGAGKLSGEIVMSEAYAKWPPCNKATMEHGPPGGPVSNCRTRSCRR